MVSDGMARRFWAKVRKSRIGCWEWTACTNDAGYGVLRGDDGLVRRAHRVSWEIHNGEQIPDGLFVLHACDNPLCVNPDHLSLGTNHDNMQDMVRKRRHVWKGRNRNGQAKLCWDDVRAIRSRKAAGESGNVLARDYGVSSHQISNICTGKQWAEEVPA